MKYKIKSYSFLKINGKYITLKDNKQYEFSAEMFECMQRQYILMGYKVFLETDTVISFSKVENEIEVFLNILNKL